MRISVVALLLLAAEAFAANQITIQGWPLPDLTAKDLAVSFADDPVYGRQACPALTRLNLNERKSEALVVRSVAASNGGKTWDFVVRTGIYWWSGGDVTASDIKEFIDARLAAVVHQRSGGVWGVPEFRVTSSGNVVKVVFNEAPEFGPYIFNGVPFYRAVKAGKIPFECAGWYRMELTAEKSLRLIPNARYPKHNSLPEVQGISSAPSKNAASAGVAFTYGKSYSKQSGKRSPLSQPTCARALDMPYALMIVWNAASAPLNDVKFRQAMDLLVPRSSLASGGAALLAVEGRGVVPRAHPGFIAAGGENDFDLSRASNLLQKAGYIRKGAGGPLLGKDGNPMNLLVISQVGSNGLIEKVLQDVYAAVGIKLSFTTDAADAAEVSGTLGAFDIDWPRINLMPNFHSKSKQLPPFTALNDDELDAGLVAYARSMTEEVPNLDALGSIQKRLSELQPVTVLLQQRACFDISGKLTAPKGEVNVLNPDWFREILF